MQRKTQIYLGALGDANNKMKGKKTGITSEDIEDLAIRLDSPRACRKDKNGPLVSSTPFKYLSAAKVLSKELKFGGVANDEEKVSIHRAILADTTTPTKAAKNGTGICPSIVLDDVESVVPRGDATTDATDLVSARRPKVGK